MMNTLEIRPERARRKVPRLFLAFRDEASVSMNEVSLLWPDLTQAAVLDLSEAGIVVAATGSVARFRVGQTIEIKLRIKDQDPQILQVTILRITARAILLSLDALTVRGRLRLEQNERENLIRSSWCRLPVAGLPTNFQSAEWWHSAFDTNLWVWRESQNGSLEKFTLEFESVAAVYETSGLKFLKSPSAFDETKGYVSALTEPLPNKVEIGQGWNHRLGKAFEFAALPASLWQELKPLLSASGKNPNV